MVQVLVQLQDYLSSQSVISQKIVLKKRFDQPLKSTEVVDLNSEHYRFTQQEMTRLQKEMMSLQWWRECTNGAFTSLGIMGKRFSQHGKVLVEDTSWHSYDSTSVRQLGPDFVNRVAQLVTYGLLVTRMNMAEHIFYSISTIISQTLLLIDCTVLLIDCNRLLASTLLSFKHCVLVNQL